MIPLSLCPNPRPPRVYEFIGFDTEGDGSPNGFRLAALYDDDGPHVFHDRSQIAPFLFRKRNRGKRIVAANLEYDWAVAFQPFDEHYEVVLTRSKWLAAIYRDRSGHSWIAWDIQRIAPLSVAEMGDLIGLSKFPTPPELIPDRDYAPPEWWCPTHHRLWCVECYCVRDAEIAFRFARFFQETLNALGGQMKPTTAGCAMDLFSRRFLDQAIAPTYPEKNDLARAAYFGGRVETLKVGTARDVSYYDFNSLYPAVYRDLAVGDPATYHQIAHPQDPARYLDKFGQFWGELQIPRSYITPLPIRVSAKTVFVSGAIRGSWTLSEVRHALEHGAAIRSCDRIVYAERVLHPFRQFVDTLYPLRMKLKAAGRPDEYVIKLMLNGLYGKFGQRTDEGLQSLVVPRGDYDLEEFADCEPVALAGRECFLRDKRGTVQSPHIHVLWAAEIAAQARMKLYDTLSEIEDECFYADTDSIHTTAQIETSTKLGGLKLAETFARVTYFAPKEYCYVAADGSENFRVKGIPRRLAEEYLRSGLTHLRQPLHTLTAINTNRRIATWREITKTHLLSPPTRWHRPMTDYNRHFIDTRPYSLSEALDALSEA